MTTLVGLYAATIPAKAGVWQKASHSQELLNVVLKFLGDHVVGAGLWEVYRVSFAGYVRMDEGDQKVPKLEVGPAS